jgi:hypothetical protein
LVRTVVADDSKLLVLERGLSAGARRPQHSHWLFVFVR